MINRLSSMVGEQTKAIKKMARNQTNFRIVCSVLICGVILLTVLILQNASVAKFIANTSVGHLPIVRRVLPSNIKDQWFCDVQCTTGTPCEYKDEVDFRVIVIVYDRGPSLERCLESVLDLDTLGDSVSVEIWVDRSKQGDINNDVVKVAEAFAEKWNSVANRRRACIHLQDKHANIGGQWVDSWKPKENTHEIAVILEDDVSISPLAYRYLKSAHKHFGSMDDIAGYTLQMETGVCFAPDALTGGSHPMKASATETVYLYPILGSWGYSPHPRAWRNFQKWYHTVRPDRNITTDHIQPFVPGIKPSIWYNNNLKRGRPESLWTIWHIKYTDEKKLFTVYSNMRAHSPQNEIYLSINRKEKGLHFGGGVPGSVGKTQKLLKEWDSDFVKFPTKENLVKMNYDCSICSNKCCFSTLCKNSAQTL